MLDGIPWLWLLYEFLWPSWAIATVVTIYVIVLIAMIYKDRKGKGK